MKSLLIPILTSVWFVLKEIVYLERKKEMVYLEINVLFDDTKNTKIAESTIFKQLKINEPCLMKPKLP